MIPSCSGPNRLAKLKYKREILEQRSGKDSFFKNSPQSPLLPEQQIFFTGLVYFEPDINFRVQAKVTRLETGNEFHIQTSTGHSRVYVKVAKLQFTIDKLNHTLYAYQEKSRIEQETTRNLFVPFKDLTSGYETYDAGRYLDLPEPSGPDIVIDFNQAYNPYCAYNDNYSCPLPPPENHLGIPIPAGEKKYLKASADLSQG